MTPRSPSHESAILSIAAGQIAENSLHLQTLILASSASWRFTSRSSARTRDECSGHRACERRTSAILR
jgi:hypothetical protein